MNPDIAPFFDVVSGTWSYLVVDPSSRQAAIIDPVLDFDAASARTDRIGADRMLEQIRQRGLVVAWVLETHAHADHLSAAAYLKRELGAPVAIGAGIRKVQETFARVFNLDSDFACDGSDRKSVV